MTRALMPRKAQRKAVRLAAMCRTQSGLRDACEISDISATGCRLSTRSLMITVGARLTIRPQGLEGLTGQVRWIEGNLAGFEFDSPLYQPVVDHLSALHAAGEAVDVTAGS